MWIRGVVQIKFIRPDAPSAPIRPLDQQPVQSSLLQLRCPSASLSRRKVHQTHCNRAQRGTGDPPHRNPNPMGRNSGTKYYAVARGRQTGVFSTWPDCEAQVKVRMGGPPLESEARQRASQSLRTLCLLFPPRYSRARVVDRPFRRLPLHLLQGFGGAKYKSFRTNAEALEYISQHSNHVAATVSAAGSDSYMTSARRRAGVTSGSGSRSGGGRLCLLALQSSARHGRAARKATEQRTRAFTGSRSFTQT